jgi:hypothetical protein
MKSRFQSANGAPHASLGQRPRWIKSLYHQALKGRVTIVR